MAVARRALFPLLTLFVAACTNDRVPSASSDRPAASATDAAVLETAPNQGMQALLTGETLRLEQRGAVVCSYVGTDRLVWPDGFALSADGSSITDDTGRVTAFDGRMIQVGGGESAAPAASPCADPATRTWFVSSVDARGAP